MCIYIYTYVCVCVSVFFVYTGHMLLSSGSMVASLSRPLVLASAAAGGGARRRRKFAGSAPVFFTSSSFRGALEGVKKTSFSPSVPYVEDS